MSADRSKVIELALGRIFRMGARPTQPGDVAEYERCRAIIMDAAAEEGIQPGTDHQPNYARDRNRGAQGD